VRDAHQGRIARPDAGLVVRRHRAVDAQLGGRRLGPEPRAGVAGGVAVADDGERVALHVHAEGVLLDAGAVDGGTGSPTRSRSPRGTGASSSASSASTRTSRSP